MLLDRSDHGLAQEKFKKDDVRSSTTTHSSFLELKNDIPTQQ